MRGIERENSLVFWRVKYPGKENLCLFIVWGGYSVGFTITLNYSSSGASRAPRGLGDPRNPIAHTLPHEACI